ncbi:DNA-binding protein [Mycobacterium paragordonae]|nr:DNA-binding protein [Mycobacterium paragordonae]TDL04079.1 DNA-binding protein [Mycobacterium paragordonae]
MGAVADTDIVKLSDAAQSCGIPADILKLMASDGLLPQVVRGRAGHIYFPEGGVPTWAECVRVLEEQRDRHLRNMNSALRRLETELEAVRNDISEAREYPRQALGIDMMSFGHWTHDRIASTLVGRPVVTSILEKFTIERMALQKYHDAYLDAVSSHGRPMSGDAVGAPVSPS